MRTSVDIPDELMKKAKIKAVEEEISLRELIIRGLQNEIGDAQKSSSKPWKDLRGKGNASRLNPNISGFDKSKK